METQAIAAKMILDRWHTALKRADALFSHLTDEALLRETAPGKNRGVYLLGHLIAVHDDMLVTLDIGPKQYPELFAVFHDAADKAVSDIPSISELRQTWTRQCAYLQQQFSALSPGQWFERHTAISAEDFVHEPHRNKLNVLLLRTTHLEYHLGQLMLLR